MMTKYKIAIFGMIGLLFIIFVILFVSGLKNNDVSEENQTNEVSTQNQFSGSFNQGPEMPKGQIVEMNETLVQNSPSLSDNEKESSQLKLDARNFVERFGSYSSSGGYGNFSVLKAQMTQSMISWVSSYENQLKEQYKDIFYSLETLSVSAKEMSKTPTSATIIVTTKRTEIKDKETSVFIQDARVEFLKLNGTWKVDGLFFDGAKTPF